MEKGHLSREFLLFRVDARSELPTLERGAMRAVEPSAWRRQGGKGKVLPLREKKNPLCKTGEKKGVFRAQPPATDSA